MTRAVPDRERDAMATRNDLKSELDALVRRDCGTSKLLQNNSQGGHWYWNLETPADAWMSPGFWELFGYDPTQKTHLTSDWLELFFPEDHKTAHDSLKEHCAESNRQYDQVLRYRHAQGHAVWVRCRGIVVRDDTGRPVRMLGAHTDVTSMMATEEESRQRLIATGSAEGELAVTRRQLQRSNSELEQFAYVASHDLQEPLRMVASFTQLLATQYEDKLDDQAKKYIHYASDGAIRMQALVESLLAVSRISKSTKGMARVDLDALVDQVIDGMTHSQALPGVTINKDSLPTILGDEQQLSEAFENLIGNAIKFNRSKTPTITIGALSDATLVRIVVQDNGIGIPQHEHKRIFEMFQRLHKRSEFEGTGMGLALAQRIVERHQGTISVESAPGQGAAFQLTFPSLDSEQTSS